MDVFHAIVDKLSVDFHHVVEAAGIVMLGLVFYSYSRRRLESVWRVDWRLRSLAYGLVFGVLTIALMISRIEVGQGIFVDARAVPIALVALVEGGWAGVVAALVASGYRAWRGGGGAVAGVIGLLATAAVARRARGVGPPPRRRARSPRVGARRRRVRHHLSVVSHARSARCRAVPARLAALADRQRRRRRRFRAALHRRRGGRGGRGRAGATPRSCARSICWRGRRRTRSTTR
jgi:hypothetical protein